MAAGESFTLEDLTEACYHLADGKLKAREVAKMYAVTERSLWRNLRWVSDLDEVRAGA